MNFIKKRWYVIVGILLITGFVLFQITQSKSKGKTVTAHTVKREDLKEELSLSGAVDAHEHAILRFQASGMLSWVGVKQGDVIKKYQGVASLDTRSLQKNLKKYLNTYMKTRWDFEQEKEDTNITKIGGYTDEARRAALRVFDKEQFDLDNSVLDVELQDIALRYAYLYSPIEGIVTKVDVPFPGVNITPAGAEFEVINPKTVYFSATADQADVVKLKQGIHGEVVLDSYPDLKIAGVVDRISFVPKQGETGTVYQVDVSMKIDNVDYAYRFGMTGDVSFVLKERNNVISVPTQYVKKEKNKYYVMKKMRNESVKTYVEIGDEIDENTIILSGIKENDVIYD